MGKYMKIKSPIWAFFLTMLITSIAKIKAPFNILIFDRFVPGLGWIEILIISFYAAWLTKKFLTNKNTSILRIRIWTVFSIVFFLQLFLGMAGFDIFLMTGKLHLPLPALIAAGPIYRGGNFFMPILLTSTIILVGPAWCSYICYIGVWDNIASSRKKKIKSAWKWNPLLRSIIFTSIIVTAVIYNIFNVSQGVAFLSAIIFAIISFSLMIIVSLRKGYMFHCTAICPIGIITNLAGKISPFRIKISSSCTECMRCSFVCRYNALDKKNIENRKPGLTCTLCGDCIEVCQYNSISYKFLKLSPENSKALFIIIIVSLHAATMVLARI
jgi:polyferredoxin